MRFGIALPAGGPLADRAAVSSAVRAAEELGYASVWSGSAAQLAAVAPVTAAVRLGLHVVDVSRSVAEVTAVLGAGLGKRFTYLAANARSVRSAAVPVGDTCLLDTSDDPPPAGIAAGWCPPPATDLAVVGRWRAAEPDRLLVVWMHRMPHECDLRAVRSAGADELVLALPFARTLDDELAGFADAAERVALGDQAPR